MESSSSGRTDALLRPFDVERILIRLTPAEREQFWELAGKYQFDAGMSQDVADAKAVCEVMDGRKAR